MPETIEAFQRRIAERRTALFRRGTHQSLGRTAIEAPEQELLRDLPREPWPSFLANFERSFAEKHRPLSEIGASERVLVAHYAYEYIIESIYERNDKRKANDEPLLRLSPMHLNVPHKLNLYYAAFSSSLHDTEPEGEIMRAKRLAKLEYDTDTARTYLPLQYVDLQLVEKFQRIMTNFYPGHPAEAATELLAAYGANRERVRSGTPQPS